MNCLLSPQTVCVFVFVCLHPCLVFPRKPNKPVPALSLKPRVCSLDVGLGCPGELETRGKKAGGRQCCPAGDQGRLFLA